MDYRNEKKMPLGIRNNNPGNIRPGDPWEGRVAVNKGFIVFNDIEHGVRALAIDVTNKYIKSGLTSVKKIIEKYAPPSENNTVAYVAAVAHSMGVGAGQKFNLTESNLRKLIRAICNHENGKPAESVITEKLITTGISMMPKHLHDLLMR